MADAPDALDSRGEGTKTSRRGRRRSSARPKAETPAQTATRRRRTAPSTNHRHGRHSDSHDDTPETTAAVTQAPEETKSRRRRSSGKPKAAPEVQATTTEAQTQTSTKTSTRRRSGRNHNAPPAEAKTEQPPAPKKSSRTRSRRGRARQPEPAAAYDDTAARPGFAPVRSRVPVTGAPTEEVPAPFAHNAEYEFARLLDFYGIEWVYEPRSFPLRWEKGHVTEAFTPDFYLPDLDLFIELTTLKSNLTAEKNRKMRQIKELYPDTKIKMLKKRDYLRLLANYGYGTLAPGQVPEVDRVMISQSKLQQRVQELGEQISRDYEGREPILVGVLRGVMVFISDLMRSITLPTAVDFMAISSYEGNGAAAVRIQKDLDINVKGRDVILIEDIVDTGMTLNHLIEYLQTKRPASVKVCALLDKRARRLMDVPLDYVGFEIEDEFVVGYGLDFRQRFRNLPYIGTLKHDLLP
jgi:hypoxanthine phosphoribosyltransferase